jgi:hypothetical protein
MRQTLTCAVGRIPVYVWALSLSCATSHSALTAPIKTTQQTVYWIFIVSYSGLCTFFHTTGMSRNWQGFHLRTRDLWITVRVIFRFSQWGCWSYWRCWRYCVKCCYAALHKVSFVQYGCFVGKCVLIGSTEYRYFKVDGSMEKSGILLSQRTWKDSF